MLMFLQEEHLDAGKGSIDWNRFLFKYIKPPQLCLLLEW